MRAQALDAAERAAETDSSWAALKRDISDAYTRSDALATTHDTGGVVLAGDMDDHLAADERVRADCASAGNDIGPPRP